MAHFIRRLGAVLALSASASMALASSDLLDIYKQALASDPTFKKAHSQWLVDRQTLPLAVTGDGTAGSGLFPNVTFTGTLKNIHEKLNYPTETDTSARTSTTNYELTITQPVFNAATWSSIASSRNTVRSATATYLYAGQSLISRAVDAYLEVLRNYEILQYYLAAQAALKYELAVAEHKYKVGLVSTVDVYEARASYDAARVTTIKQRNTLATSQEDLRAITGQSYACLKGMPEVIPLIVPKPQNIDAWVKTAEKQNYGLLADRFAMLAAHGDLRTKYLSHLPTLNAVADYDHLNHDSASISNSETPSDKTTYVGLSLSFPVFQGGYLYSSTKQTRYTYLKASDTVDLDHRTVIKDAREDYLSVTSGISQVQADWASVLSARKQLDVTQAGYAAGSQTMEDLLDAVTTLFSSLNSWIGDRYDYVESLVQLKYDAGTLSPKDVEQLNSWLTKTVTVNHDDSQRILNHMAYFDHASGHKPKVKSPQVAAPVDDAASDALIRSVKAAEAANAAQVPLVHTPAKPKQRSKQRKKSKPAHRSSAVSLPEPRG